MYTSSGEDFEYVDISNIDMILNNKIDKNVEEMAMNNEKDKWKKWKLIMKRVY